MLGQYEKEVASAQKSPSKPLNEWYLPQYIDVAEELNIIKSDTGTAARLAQNFRNLIHPGRVERLEQICDRGTAFATIAALEHVVRDLTPT